MASVQENIDKLTQAWIGEGRALPILFPMETTAEVVQFGQACGISKVEMLEVMRVLVARTPDASVHPSRSN